MKHFVKTLLASLSFFTEFALANDAKGKDCAHMRPPPSANVARPPYLLTWEMIDTNRDCFISLQEAKDKKVRYMIDNFVAIDTNKNGKLSKAEHLAHCKTEPFRKGDANNDGGISLAEAWAAKMERVINNFSALDADKNGKVTQAELNAMHKTSGKYFIDLFCASH